MDDILLESSLNVWREVKPLKVAGSIVLIFLELRDMLLDFIGSQLQSVAKFVLFK